MSVVEKEAKLRKMMEDELETKSNHHTPEGLFTKPTQDIVDGLLKDAHGDEELALRRITFYINRAGDGLSNKTAVNAAKRELEKKAEAKREAKNIQFHNMLSEYFGEAYTNMFEDDKENKRMPKRDAFWYLLNNDINLAWMLGAPHPELIDPKRKKVLGLFDVMQNGKLKMLTHKNDQEHGYKAKWVDEDIYITPEEFKDIIDADINNETNAPWTKEINDHYRDVEEEKSILKSGEQLFNAWINRFYEENKDELGLKSPKDKRTYDAFVNWWNKQTDYTRRNYAPGVSDIWDLATLDVHRGMPLQGMVTNIEFNTLDNQKMPLDDVTINVSILGGEEQKCATPTISYANGKLVFDSETEDVVFHSSITDTDIASYLSKEISLSVTYTITVYATKEGYEDSNVATATLCWIEAEPRSEGLEEDAVNEVKALPVLIQVQAGFITVQGLEAGTEVSAYNTSGMLLDTIISSQDTATLRTKLPAGSTAIVKIGQRTVKVMVK